MIARLIHWSIGNRFLVLLATLFITALGIWSLRNTPPATPAKRRRLSRTR